MAKYKFSVILGVYNHQQTIGQLADALNQQTFKDFEILFCDDGSEDFAKAIFEKKLHPLYKRSYRYLTQKQKGMRLAKNVNQGIKVAQGEYCVFIMGDSFPDPQYLEVLNIFAQPHRILCGVRYQVVNDVGVDMDFRLKKRMIPPENVLLPSLPFNVVTGNGLCIPTEALQKYGGWDESFKGYGGEDNEIVGRLYYQGYTVWSIVDAKLYHNWHKPSPSTNIGLLAKKLQSYSGIEL